MAGLTKGVRAFAAGVCLTVAASPASARRLDVSVHLADFASGALAARDNFRLRAFYERGAREFPEDTHFDGLNWHEGFTEVWLYALRSARLALSGTSHVSVSDKERQQLLRKLWRTEEGLVAAAGEDEDSQRAAWRAAHKLLRAGGALSLALEQLQASADALSFPYHSESLGDAGDPLELLLDSSATGLLWPQSSVDITRANHRSTLAGGASMPRLGLGTTMLEGAEGQETVLRAIRDHGYRLIDTAQSYNNEAVIGRAMVASGVKRSELFVVTKLSDLEDVRTEARVRKRVAKQLKKLQTTYIDLYFLHGPDDFPEGSLRAWRVLEDFHRQGVIRALGVSNFDVEQLDVFRQHVSVAPHAVQNKFSIYHHGNAPMPPEAFMQEVASSQSPMVFMGYCNLDVYPNVLEPLLDTHVLRIAAAHNRTPAQVLLRHALQMGTVAIPKTSGKHGRLAENMDVFSFSLTDAEILRLNGLAQLAALEPIPHVADLFGIWPKARTADEL